ncbi:MAG: 4Fe-4S dicluster domain-containing protein, partial [Longicatena sp.]
IAGGPMMGKTIVNDKFVIDRNMNALTILENIPFSSVACLRCGKCSDHCPSGLQPVRIAQAVKLKDTASMQKLGAMDCIECGLCTFVCPSRLDVTENVRKAKRALALVKK